MPGDTAAKVHQTKEPEQKSDFDEWLARIICYAFSVPPQWAVKLMNRATADNQSAQAEDEGLAPTKEWVKDLIDAIITDEFASPDLELAWLDEDTDAKQTEAQLEARLKLGALTLNELRDSLGLDPYTIPAADRPMVLTATGYVPIEANAVGNPAEVSANAKSAETGVLKAAADDPKHPGWPAGTPEGKGGQFRPRNAESGVESSSRSDDGSDSNDTSRSQRYAAQEDGTLANGRDASTIAAGVENDGTRLQLAAREFERFDLTNNPTIDITSLKLSIILALVMDDVVRTSGMTPQEYGRLVHAEFAALVKGSSIEGINPQDVETTFPEGRYGSPNSIRTDVVLRDNAGSVIAIYDVKTGKTGLTQARADQLRVKTKASSDTPVIELRDEGILLKLYIAGLFCGF